MRYLQLGLAPSPTSSERYPRRHGTWLGVWSSQGWCAASQLQAPRVSYHVIRLWATPHQTRPAFPLPPHPRSRLNTSTSSHHHETRHSLSPARSDFLRHRRAPVKQRPPQRAVRRSSSPLQGSQFGAPIAGRRNQDCFFLSFSLLERGLMDPQLLATGRPATAPRTLVSCEASV